MPDIETDIRDILPKRIAATGNAGNSPASILAMPPSVPFAKPAAVQPAAKLSPIQGIAWDTNTLSWLDMKAYAAAIIERYEGDAKPDVVKLADALAQWAAGVDMGPPVVGPK